jgi:hypothetical protein
MTAISSKISKKFLDLASQELQGDWVIMGGAVMILLGVRERFTVDIDLAGPEAATQADTLKLMGIAEKIGLAPEAINQAGAFFLNRIPHWKENLVTMIKSDKFSLYRPNSFLFLQLKIARLSESDLSDCINMLKIEPITPKQAQILKSEITKASKKSSATDEFRKRCALLFKKLEGLG